MNNMKWMFCCLGLVLGICRVGVSQQAVEDLGLIEQNAQNQITNFAQFEATVNNTLTTANTAKQQLAQMGNYANLQNLPGVAVLQQGLAIFGKAQGAYSQLQGLTNVGQLSSQFQGVLNQYGSNYQNLLTGPNTTTGVAQSYTIPMDTAIGQAVKGYASDVQTLNGQRQNLEQQLLGAMNRLQGASTQAEVEKVNGEIAGINGQLNSVNERIQQSAQASSQAAQQANAAADATKQAGAANDAARMQKGVEDFTNQLQFSDQSIKW
jgi:hypothetical protein